MSGDYDGGVDGLPIAQGASGGQQDHEGRINGSQMSILTVVQSIV